MVKAGCAGYLAQLCSMRSQIDENSIYQKSGVQNDDIITSINGTELNSIAGSISLLRSLKGADHVDIEVRRGNASQKISVDVN